MAEEIKSDWLEIIGKSLAFLCVQEISRNDPKRVPDLVAKVKFLESMGLSTKDAAGLMGTTANSVKTNQRAREKKGNGRAKKGRK